MKKSVRNASLLLVTAGSQLFCFTLYQNVAEVVHQSTRSKQPVIGLFGVFDATIIICCQIGGNDGVSLFAQNNTDKIMTIDQTKSFCCNQFGNLIPYYDPTARAQSQPTMIGSQIETSVNLGSIDRVLGTTLGKFFN